jgi:signal transduction histidine kinase
MGMLACVFLVLLAVYLLWFYRLQQQYTEAELIEQSRVLVTEMEAVWDFISINQDTINYGADGTYEYKGLHCAIAGKAVAALFSVKSDYNIRFTNIDPRNESNAPDAFEREALELFNSSDAANTDTTKTNSKLEFYDFVDDDGGGQPVFRYVSAMRVTEQCIECHGSPKGQIDPTGYPKEGWRIGEIAGAVSVKVPTKVYFDSMYSSIRNNVLFFLLIMLCILAFIYITLSRLIARPLASLGTTLKHTGSGLFTPAHKESTMFSSKEIDDLFRQFNTMSTNLSVLYTQLESQVSERTLQLSEANADLQRQKAYVEKVNSKLKQENRYKTDFLAIVSHELRTPLTSILAFTELMAQYLPKDNEQAHKQLAEIDINGQLLLEMVDNILETARIQAGSEQLNLELVDFNDIVGIVEAQSTALAEKKGIELSTRVKGDVPLITSDWEKLRRILVNLVSNAIKFTPSGGTVRLTVSFDEAAKHVQLEVRDTGIGIPADKQVLIFERFTQENMSTVRRYGGSGLGLSLVRDLSRMLGGTVSVRSELDKGSTFTVLLPSDLMIGESYDE